MITIVSKEIIDGYVQLVLSDGQEVAIEVDWATKFVQEAYEDKDENGNPITAYRDTDKTLLEYEIEQATTLANQRQKDKQLDLDAAQSIIDGA